MQPGDDQLGRNKEQDDCGDAEELSQVNAHAALDEHDTEDNGQRHPHERAKETHEFGGIKTYTGEDDDRLYAFAKDHEEDKGKQAPFGTAVGCQRPDFGFDLAFELAGRAHHENDHGDHEQGSHQHDPAFYFVFIDGQVGQDHAAGDASQQGSDKSGIDGLAQVRTADPG